MIMIRPPEPHCAVAQEPEKNAEDSAEEENPERPRVR